MKLSKNIKLTTTGKIIIALFIIFLTLSIYFIFFHQKNKEPENINFIEETEYYDIKINYDKTDNNELNNEVEKYIQSKKDEFIQITNDSKDVITAKYNLIIEAQTYNYQGILYTHIVSNMYTGGAHYIRSDKTYIHNNKSFLDITNFLNDEKSFNELKLLAQHYLAKYAEEKEFELNDEWLAKGTETTIENYEHFYFSENGLTIIFPPYQISAWSNGEIKITIPYEKINDLLKKEYQNNNEETSEVVKITPEKRDLEQFKGKKLIAFTFDDGPNTKTTSILLDGLKEHNAKVTFFVLGSRVAYHQDVLKRAYQEGNQIGSHTYNHRNLLLLDDDNIITEINDTNKAIKDIIGVEPILIRPPYGNTNKHIKNLSLMHTINWNIDSIDWQLKDRNLIKNEIVTYAHDGAIVLLHDIYLESVEGALLAMEELEKQGYAFVTISEMAELKGKELDYTSTYFGF